MTSASSGRLRVQICGSLAVEHDGQRIEGQLPGRQGRLLFTYLVVNRYRPVRRDELAEALWREPDPAAVDARLNPLLSKLRRIFGAGAIDGRTTVRLNLPDAWVDLEAASEAIHRAESAAGPRTIGPEPGARCSFPCSSPSVASFPAKTARGSTRSVTISTVLHLRALECYAAIELGLGGT